MFACYVYISLTESNLNDLDNIVIVRHVAVSFDVTAQPDLNWYIAELSLIRSP